MREAANRDEIDVWLLDSIPRLAAHLRIVLYEATGGEQLPGVRVRRIRRERGGCELAYFGPPPLQQTQSGELSKAC